jgi:hypothetical protein
MLLQELRDAEKNTEIK